MHPDPAKLSRADTAEHCPWTCDKGLGGWHQETPLLGLEGVREYRAGCPADPKRRGGGPWGGRGPVGFKSYSRSLSRSREASVAGRGAEGKAVSGRGELREEIGVNTQGLVGSRRASEWGGISGRALSRGGTGSELVLAGSSGCV